VSAFCWGQQQPNHKLGGTPTAHKGTTLSRRHSRRTINWWEFAGYIPIDLLVFNEVYFIKDPDPGKHAGALLGLSGSAFDPGLVSFQHTECHHSGIVCG